MTHMNVMSTWTMHRHMHIYIRSHIDKYGNFIIWVISVGLTLARLNKVLIVDE